MKTEQRVRFSKDQRKAIKEEQNKKYTMCKTELDKFHIDHILPLAFVSILSCVFLDKKQFQ